jgi:hypothetical protein
MLKELKKETDNKLKEYIINYLLEFENEEKVEGFINDLLNYGCVSGMVEELIYYNNTIEFYKKFKNEINELLYELLEHTGLSIQELFGKKWDSNDPLALKTNNKNLLAWFGFEKMTKKIYINNLIYQ